MIDTISNKRWITLFFCLTFLITLVDLLIIQSTSFSNNSDILSFAITADITVGIPLLYYFISSRKRKVSTVATLAAFLICIAISSFILPSENQYYLDKVKKLLIFTELAIMIYSIIKIRKIINLYKALSKELSDFVINVSDSLSSIFGNSGLLSLVVGEICTLRYGLFFWIGKKEILKGQNYYTTYKNSGYIPFWCAICFVTPIEILVVHLILLNFNKLLAIIVLVLSIYTFIFIISDLVSIIKRPVIFHNGKLFFRIGIRWNAVIEPAKIQSIEIIKKFNRKRDKTILDSSLMGNPNIKITLCEPITFKSFYGIKRISDKVVFNIDNEKEFIEEVNNLLL